MQVKITQENFNDVYNRFKNGESFTSIAKDYNCDRTTVSNFLERNGVVIDKEWNWKLKSEQLEEIKMRYFNGESSSDLCKEYGVHRTSIINFLKRCNVKPKELSEARRIYDIDENYFDSIDTPAKAYVLGFLYADGCYFPFKNGNSTVIKMGLAEQDKDILQTINDLFQPDKPLLFSDRRSKNINWQNVWTMTIQNKHMCESLYNFGIHERKTFDISFPYFLSKELYNPFLLGFFDGDGCVRYKKYGNKITPESRIYIAGYKDFIIQLKELIEKELNIHCHISQIKGKHEGIFKFYISGNQQVLKFGEYLYKNNPGFYMIRKYNKFQEIKQYILEKEQRIINNKKYCKICGDKHWGLGYCKKHLQQFHSGKLQEAINI
jgi:Mor family transcriptional regulator